MSDIENIKKRLDEKSEEYLKTLLLMPKEWIINPEKVIGPKRIEESINYTEKRLNEILEDLLQSLQSLMRTIGEVIKAKDSIFEFIHKYASMAEYYGRIRERIEELKRLISGFMDSMREVHTKEVSLLLSHLIRLHNLIVYDLKVGIEPSKDEKVWDFIDAINLILLQYGVMIISWEDFSLKEGFIDFLLTGVSDKKLSIYSIILSRYMSLLSCKSHLDLIKEKFREK